MITIISGTNRQNSYSIKVAELYQHLLEEHGEASNLVDLKELPETFLFSALYDNVGKDEAFNKLISDMYNSSKFIFIVPEYNGSFPGVLKTFIDGLSYPSPLKGKKCALVGISSGNMAGALALSHLTDILNYLGVNVLAVKPRLPKIESVLVNGEIKDQFLIKLIKDQIKEFINF